MAGMDGVVVDALISDSNTLGDQAATVAIANYDASATTPGRQPKLDRMMTTEQLTEERRIEMALLERIKAGETKHAKELLRDPVIPAQLNARNPDGETTLILAARKGLPEICCDILRVRSDQEAFKLVNAKERRGSTALHIAAGRGYTEVVRDILSRPDFTGINARTRDGQTALILAARMGHRDICDLLLGRSDFAEINATDEQGRTALHWAAGNSCPEILRAILKRSDFTMHSAKSKDGYTATDIATRYFIDEAVEILRFETQKLIGKHELERMKLERSSTAKPATPKKRQRQARGRYHTTTATSIAAGELLDVTA
jgi:hypothetical protein